MRDPSQNRRGGAVLVLATAFALMVTMFAGPASAATSLFGPHVGADSTTFKEECKGDEALEPGQVLWHFVLVQTTALNSGELTAEFETAGTIGPIAYTKYVGGVVHWNVITPGDDVLLGAVATSDGGQLNLSHVCHGEVTDLDGTIVVKKYFDANGNGILDVPPDVVITGWKVNIDPVIGDTFTTVNEQVPADTYEVSEYMPVPPGTWVHSYSYVDGTKFDADNPVYATILSGGTATVEFGNYCTVPSGGKTLGYWSNKNGGAEITGPPNLLPGVLALHLRKADGSLLGSVNLKTFQTFLTSASATNMANMLSAQLAAMHLNVASGRTDGTLYVPGYGGTVNELMAAANASLATDGYTVESGPIRTYQEMLKNYLDGLNNGGGLIPAAPCYFGFEEAI